MASPPTERFGEAAFFNSKEIVSCYQATKKNDITKYEPKINLLHIKRPFT